MPHSTTVKVKALCLIFLLVGQDARRIANDRAAVLAVSRLAEMGASPGTTAEEEWKTLNANCSWSYYDRSCVGPECSYRPLPLDWRLSQSCRLSDDTMLKEDVAKKYYMLQSRLLARKSEKFTEECYSTSMLNVPGTRKCQRRSMHMLRAMEFVAKAQTKSFVKSLTPEERAETRAANEDSLSNITAALGSDGASIRELQNKMKANAANIRKDVRGNMAEVVGILWKLLRGTEEQKAEAVQQIHDMPGDVNAPVPPPTAEEEAALEEQADEQEKLTAAEEKLMDRVNSFEEQLMADAEGGNATADAQSMLERMSKEVDLHPVVVAVLFVVIVLFLFQYVAGIVSAILGIFLTLIFVSLLVCGIGSILSMNDCAQTNDLDAVVRCEIQCAKEVIQKPIEWVKEIGNAFGDMFNN